MSTISKQVSQSRLAHGFYNGDFRYFDNATGANFDVFNLDCKAKEIFEGSKVTTALNKFEFSNFLGFRLFVDFTLELPKDTSGTWRDFFDELGSLVNRTVETGTANGGSAGSTTLVINAGVSSVDDWFNGLLVSGLTGGDVVITDYVGGTLTATLAASRTWSNSDALTFKIQPNFKTLIAFSPDTETANMLFYNVVGIEYGFNRDLTINKNMISLSLSSVELQDTLPDSFTIA